MGLGFILRFGRISENVAVLFLRGLGISRILYISLISSEATPRPMLGSETRENRHVFGSIGLKLVVADSTFQ